jgi:hypothetical protein
MAEPIVASYVRENDDWAVTVSGRGKELTGKASGIVGARERADELVKDLGSDAEGATVVHLLNGSALEFTSTYMTARLARPEPAPSEQPTEAKATATTEARRPTGRKPQTKSTRRPKARFTADIGDALTSAKVNGKPPTPRKGTTENRPVTTVAETAAQGS